MKIIPFLESKKKNNKKGLDLRKGGYDARTGETAVTLSKGTGRKTCLLQVKELVLSKMLTCCYFRNVIVRMSSFCHHFFFPREEMNLLKKG